MTPFHPGVFTYSDWRGSKRLNRCSTRYHIATSRPLSLLLAFSLFENFPVRFIECRPVCRRCIDHASRFRAVRSTVPNYRKRLQAVFSLDFDVCVCVCFRFRIVCFRVPAYEISTCTSSSQDVDILENNSISIYISRGN